jgi:hypothetical protein
LASSGWVRMVMEARERILTCLSPKVISKLLIVVVSAVTLKPSPRTAGPGDRKVREHAMMGSWAVIISSTTSSSGLAEY